jgi:Tfp pilus assembly PilM family ATPase
MSTNSYGTRKSFFDFFPTPRFLEMPAPGLALTDTGLKFVEFGSGPTGQRIKRYGGSALPKGLIEAGNIIDREGLVRALENFRKSFNLRYIRTSLPEERAYLFQTTIPTVSQKELRTAVEATIEENVPLSVSEVIFDFVVLKEQDSVVSGTTAVSVSVIPESLVMEYLSVFRSAGFMPLHFDVESQAVSKSVIGKDDESVSLIVNLNKTKAGLYIVSRGAVTFTSTIAMSAPGVSTLTPPTYADASGKPLVSEDANILATYPGLKMLAGEIEKVYMYWQTQADRQNRRLVDIEKVILCGEEAGRDGVAHYLTQQLETKVELANVWRNAFSFDQYVPSISLKDSLFYAGAVGLALPREDRT